jgi:hypothetical protein
MTSPPAGSSAPPFDDYVIVVFGAGAQRLPRTYDVEAIGDVALEDMR